MPQPTRGRGRPTEQATPVTEAVRFRLTPEELARLKAVAEGQGVPVSRLLRRAVREIVNGGPDLFDDGVKGLSEVARQLAAIGRNLNQVAFALNAGDPVYNNDVVHAVKDIRQSVEDARDRYAVLVQASRQRWVAVRGRRR